MKTLSLFVTVLCLAAGASAQRAVIPTISHDPYTGAIVVDTATGAVLFEDGADAPVYPASVVKLMGLLLLLERIDAGQLALDEQVQVTREAAEIGGSQVYLKEGESFTVEEMLYALSIKSANDVAAALAIKVAGSKEAFVGLMNRRAAELGMRATTFATVHGLPPARGQQPDISTARDMALLSLEVVKHPAALHYTATKERRFRNGTFEMLTHNRLLHTFEGCDGLKTGYHAAGGFSISATAVRGGRRVIAVVMGCKSRPVRDDKAGELLSLGFQNLPQRPEPPPAVAALAKDAVDAATTPVAARRSVLGFLFSAVVLVGKLILALVVLAVAAAIFFNAWTALARRRREKGRYRP